MTKQELIDKVNDLSAQLDNLKATIGSAAIEVKEAIRQVDNLPSEVDEIEDDEDDETEDEKEPD